MSGAGVLAFDPARAATAIERLGQAAGGEVKSVSHAANILETEPKQSKKQWDKREASCKAALASGTQFALVLAGASPVDAADRCILAASTIRDVLGHKHHISSFNLLKLSAEFPEVLDAWLALIGKRAVDL